MKPPSTVASLESLGRVRLSENFFMRDFLYSEIANHYGLRNIPENPDLAIQTGSMLCAELLEPLQKTFGRLAIRSAYRSPAVNEAGNRLGHNCGSNESNRAAHIWDQPDRDGNIGAMACVVVPWFADRYERGTDWRALAFWINDHLPYHRIQFFPKLCAFNIGWRSRPERLIGSYIEPKGILLRNAETAPEHRRLYAGFPAFAGA